MSNIKIKVKKLREDAVIPKYAHDGDVGMDFTALSVEYDAEHDMYIYHTGLSFESDFNFGQFLFPRSSNRKTEGYLCNSVGIADSAIYRGEIMFCYKNRDSIKLLTKVSALKTSLKNANSFEEFKENYLKLIDISEDNIEAQALELAPYKVGDRIGQMVILGYPTVEFEVVDELSDSSRGSNGFGSTGN